jgi:hypothetical protein
VASRAEVESAKGNLKDRRRRPHDRGHVGAGNKGRTCESCLVGRGQRNEITEVCTDHPSNEIRAQRRKLDHNVVGRRRVDLPRDCLTALVQAEKRRSSILTNRDFEPPAHENYALHPLPEPRGKPQPRSLHPGGATRAGGNHNLSCPASPTMVSTQNTSIVGNVGLPKMQSLRCTASPTSPVQSE